MEAQNWRTISHEGQELAIRAERTGSDVTVLITDLSRLWCDRQSGEEIVNKSKKLNPLLEASSDKLLAHLYFLMSQKSTELNVSKKDEIISVKLKSRLDNLPFVWEFILSVESAGKLQQYVTRPLLAMLKENANIQEELCTIIRNKDKEIDDYKASGAAVSRKQLLTEEFNKERYFVERRWRSLDESIKHDPVEMFCDTSAEKSNRFYNEVVKRIIENDEQKNAESMDAATDAVEEKIQNLTDDTVSTDPAINIKEAEASRHAIRKRLQEEERNAILKLTQKKKPKFF